MQMRSVRVGCEFVHVSAQATPAVFNVEPLADQRPAPVAESWSVSPSVPAHSFVDLYGNRSRRLVLPAGESLSRFDAVYQVPDAPDARDPQARQLAPEEIPDELLIFTLPSRLCPSDSMRDLAWKLFGQSPANGQRVQDICDYVNSHLAFQWGSSESTTTARDAYIHGFGVCRDFAHLGVTFCRALNIPTRYVFGYLPNIDGRLLPPPMDFSAWMEVYLDGRWFTFDPRNNEPRTGRVLISRGRDAADVAMVTTFGVPWLKRMTVCAHEYPAGMSAEQIMSRPMPGLD